ncbi:DENN domain-containing protein 1A [Echinococcus granulosus]|uniref:DENN domain containing protein 1A n=1 Tax=Echinococcus granulosus TaxID=6210 RepID=A0A068WBX6_ECHGR|nr:DENN domain-containing protein 1A [Echinococcus granulosus]CDS15102.1 DENN domain containing protein 1A [Echinococcus granulosus]
MIDLVTRHAEGLLNFFVVYEIETRLIRFLFPISTGREFVDRLIEFGPGCCKELRCGEFYILLFTDNEGRSEYAHCLQTAEDLLICFTSYLPWFECFHRLLEEVKSKELYKHEQLPTLQQFIAKLYSLKPPPAEKNAISIPYPVLQIPYPQLKARNLPTYQSTDDNRFSSTHHRDIRLPIPTSSNPHFLKALEHYYALEPCQWVDIFTSMLLEKSILFYSKSRQRLTYCIIAAVSLLYPLSWVAPIYPVLSRKFLQILESPVPFIAGIHSCMYEEAKPYITYGTRVVDLDGQRIYVNMPEEELDNEAIPTPILDFFGVQFTDGTRFLKSAMNKKSHEFASWKTSQLPVQNFLFHQAKPFFAIIVNLLGYFRDCTNSAGQVDFQQMIACQDCPQLKAFLQRLYESQMVHCFLDERLAKHTVDEFDVQARLLSDKCKERLHQSGSNKLNFGDPRWIECKRSITTNGVINNLRIRRKLGQQFIKLTSRGATKTSRSKSEKAGSPLTQKEAANGFPPTPSISHSRSTNMADAGRGDNFGSAESRPRATLPVTNSRPIRPQQNARMSTPATTMATRFSERLPSPVECLCVPQGVPLAGPVREAPITPTSISQRPPIPPKNFVLLASNKQFHCSTASPPIPRRNFQNTFPSAPFSSTSYSERFKSTSFDQDTNTPPPALPPRRPSLQPTHRPRPPLPQLPPSVVMTSFSSVASTSATRVNSTPDLLDGAGSSGGGGSTSSESVLASSASLRTVDSVDGRGSGGEAGAERLTPLGFRPPCAFPRSNSSISPLYPAYPRESAI